MPPLKEAYLNAEIAVSIWFASVVLPLWLYFGRNEYRWLSYVAATLVVLIGTYVVYVMFWKETQDITADVGDVGAAKKDEEANQEEADAENVEEA